MTDEQYQRLLGRLSALELLMIINELKTLRGSTSEMIAQEAKRRADFWRQIGKNLEEDDAAQIDTARTDRLGKLGDLLVQMAGPLAEELEQAGLMSKE